MHWISLSATLTWQVLAHNRHVLLRFVAPYGIHTCRSCEHCPPKQEPRTVTRWPRWPSALFSHSSALHSCRRLFTSGNAHLEACEESRGCAYRLSESRDGFSIVSVMSKVFFGSCTHQYFPKILKRPQSAGREDIARIALQGCGAESFLWPKAAASATCQADCLPTLERCYNKRSRSWPAKDDPNAIWQSYPPNG